MYNCWLIEPGVFSLLWLNSLLYSCWRVFCCLNVSPFASIFIGHYYQLEVSYAFSYATWTRNNLTSGKATPALSILIIIEKMYLYVEKYTNHKCISQWISIKWTYLCNQPSHQDTECYLEASTDPRGHNPPSRYNHYSDFSNTVN